MYPSLNQREIEDVYSPSPLVSRLVKAEVAANSCASLRAPRHARPSTELIFVTFVFHPFPSHHSPPPTTRSPPPLLEWDSLRRSSAHHAGGVDYRGALHAGALGLSCEAGHGLGSVDDGTNYPYGGGSEQCTNHGTVGKSKQRTSTCVTLGL